MRSGFRASFVRDVRIVRLPSRNRNCRIGFERVRVLWRAPQHPTLSSARRSRPSECKTAGRIGRREIKMQSSLACSTERFESAGLARQDVMPGTAPSWEFDAVVSDTWAASCKSAQIFWGGMSAWNAALFGIASLTVEDAFSAWEVKRRCATVRGCAKLEHELSRRLLSALTRRLCLLARMAMQLGEDAAYPLQRLVGLELERLTPAFGRVSFSPA